MPDPYYVDAAIEMINGQSQFVLRATESGRLYGFQFFGRLPGESAVSMGDELPFDGGAFAHTHVYLKNHELACIGYSPELIHVTKGSLLASLPLNTEELSRINLSSFQPSEVYPAEGEARPIAIRFSSYSGEAVQFSLQSNPVLQVPVVQWQTPSSGITVQFSLYDGFGKALSLQTLVCSGKGETMIAMPTGCSGGVYYLKVRTAGDVLTLPFVFVK
jgi:hypothetical protein